MFRVWVFKILGLGERFSALGLRFIVRVGSEEFTEKGLGLRAQRLEIMFSGWILGFRGVLHG